MSGNDLYDLLHARTLERGKEIIENRKIELMNMNGKILYITFNL